MSRKLTRSSYNFETRIKSKLYVEAIAWAKYKNERSRAHRIPNEDAWSQCWWLATQVISPSQAVQMTPSHVGAGLSRR